MFADVVNASFSTEVLGCAVGEGSGYEVAGCSDPQGLRYIVPTVGVRGSF